MWGRTTRLTTCAVALALGGLLVASCSSAEDANTPPTTEEPQRRDPGASEASLRFSEFNEHASQVDRSDETVRIGLSNNEGGALSLPEFRVGAEVGAEYLNEHGGVNGAQIELVTCLSDGSPEGAINCANQFVEEDVDVVTYGVEVSIDAALDVYRDADIPLIAPTAYGTEQRNDENSTLIGSAAGAYAVWPLDALAADGVESVAFIAQDVPSSQSFVSRLESAASVVGVEVVNVSLVDPANPDYSAAVQASIGSSAEAIWALDSEPGCTAFVTATIQLGYDGVVLAGACSQYIDAVGEDAVGTLNVIDSFVPGVAASAPAHIEQHLDAYEVAMTDAGHGDLVGSFAISTFAFMQDMGTLLATIPAGPIDAASIATAAAADVDLPSFIAPDFNCGADPWPSESAYCRAGLMILEVVDGPDGPERRPLFEEQHGFVYDPDVAAEVGS